MRRIAIAASVIGLLACGSGDSGQTTSNKAESTLPVGMAGSPPTQPAAAPEGGTASAAVSKVISSCLNLVAQAKFSEAVPVCTTAVAENPQNADVKAALDKAQSAVSGAAANAGAAAAGAASAAEGAAADARAKAASGLMEKMPE